jgi:hypothetical protein
MWRKLLLAALLFTLISFFAACDKKPQANLPTKPKIVAAPGVLDTIGQYRKTPELPALVDLLTGAPVRGATMSLEIYRGLVRFMIDAPGYLRRYRWERLTDPWPESITLSPKDPEIYRDMSWKYAHAPRLIMLGFDGMTESLFRAGMERHELPAFSVLLEKGTRGLIESCCGTSSPAVWTTIYTGLTPGQHGIEDFLSHDVATGNPVALTYANIKAPRLWQMLARSGQKTIVGGGLLMDPALNFFGPTPDLTRKLQLFRRTIAAERPRLVIIYEEESDHCGHQYWKDMDPEPFRAHGWAVPEEEAAFDGPRIAQAYRNLDSWVATAMLMAGPETVILINSDHGFQGMPETPPVIVNSEAFAQAVALPGFRSCDTNDINEIQLCADQTVDSRQFAQQLRDARLEDGARPFTEVTDRSMASFRNEGSVGLAVRVRLDGVVLFDALYHERKLNVGGRQIAVRDFLQMNPSSGGHFHSGLFFVAGRDIKPGSEVKHASVFDITPTALTILGLPIGRDMPGQVWLSVFRKTPNVTTVESYGRLVPGMKATPASPQELQQLRSLGYIN